MVTRGESVETPSVDGLGSSGAVLGSEADEVTTPCVANAGACGADAGPPEPLPCVPGPRDCSSTLDNDCNAQPDNTLDDVCRCAHGTTQARDEHPGFDGQGPCRAGSQTCTLAEGNGSSDWSPCDGAVGPLPEDSCAVAGDDSDCDGNLGESTVACGSDTDVGLCQPGTTTCVDGAFGPCVGAVGRASRYCSSPANNDCDGSPDNTIDAVCQCVPGQGNSPCSGDANLARCGNTGRCEPCQADADCGDCESGRCLAWYRDRDGDRVGDLADEERTFVALSGDSTPPTGYVAEGGDCCDLTGADQTVAATIFPRQTEFFEAEQAVCPDVTPFDYDCSGEVEFLLQEDTAEYGGSCLEIPEDECRGTGIRMWSSGTAPACGVEGAIVLCDVSTFRDISTCQAIVGAGNFRNACH